MEKHNALKILLTALSGPWYIEECAALQYAEILQDFRSGSFSDLLDSLAEQPYRVDASGNTSADGEVLVIPISGVMMKSSSCFSSGTAAMASAIQAANQDKSILSIVLKMDTPGGSVDGTEALANAVQSSKKTIVTYAEQMCSAGYWAGSGASEIIIAGETACVGSIGTMCRLQDPRAAMEASGVKEKVIFATRSTRKNKSTQDALDGKPEALISEYLDPLNNVFLHAVEQNRAGKIDPAKEDVLEGAVYFGSNAMKVGLADKIGSFPYAVKRSLQLAKTIK